ncbi:hypothetical protein HDU83_009939 [Entophlyctis luteolus]|nr:hypothetical protein HDU83_009939 [Entophlyctis luteolus]
MKRFVRVRHRPSIAAVPDANFARTPINNHTRNERSSSFVDLKVVAAVSGNGGNGSIHFMRGPSNPFGPPCGGNGGRGGDVYVVASREVTSLGGLQNRYKAADGLSGDRNNRHGADGSDLEIVVPVGTLVRQVDSLQYISEQRAAAALAKSTPSSAEESGTTNSDVLPKSDVGDAFSRTPTAAEDDHDDADEFDAQQKRREEANSAAAERELDEIREHFIFRKDYIPHPDRIRLLRSRIPPARQKPERIFCDLSTHGQRTLIARGGRHGFGNPHFTSNDIKGPGIASRGDPGVTVWLEMELKTIADAGLVGLPNAGKSTLLKRITNAMPKIASYPFTTLNPYVGTIEYPDSHSITIADIPGLVAGASMNVGLGHEFLRHVERSNVLIYVVDLGARDSAADFMVLRDELCKYKKELLLKRGIVLANKADLGTVARLNLESLKQAVADECKRVQAVDDMVVIPISAREDKNINLALMHLRKVVEQIKL